MKTITITIIVPEGVSVGVSETVGPSNSPDEPPFPTEAPSSGKPSCPSHGPMFFKEGTNKSGKPYAGWFCSTEGCETKPIWSKVR